MRVVAGAMWAIKTSVQTFATFMWDRVPSTRAVVSWLLRSPFGLLRPMRGILQTI